MSSVLHCIHNCNYDTEANNYITNSMHCIQHMHYIEIYQEVGPNHVFMQSIGEHYRTQNNMLDLAHYIMQTVIMFQVTD